MKLYIIVFLMILVCDDVIAAESQQSDTQIGQSQQKSTFSTICKETLEATKNWAEAHNNFPEFIETLRKIRRAGHLNELEQTVAARLFIYNEINEFNKLLGAAHDDWTFMEDDNLTVTEKQLIISSKGNLEFIRIPIDYTYTSNHPKGKAATVTDWVNVLNDLAKTVSNFQKEDSCHNDFV